jgi:DNA repair exonuclease SbcCD ATPase subunit
VTYYSVHDGQDLERTLRRLKQQTSTLSDDVERLESRYRELDSQVDRLDDRVDELERGQEKLEEAHERRSAELAAAVRSLAATVGWVERRLRAEHDLTAVPLDETDETLRQLAERARQGQQSASVLLDPSTRASHQHWIDELGRLEDQIEQVTAKALDSSKKLAAAAPGTDAYKKAVVGYRQLALSLAAHQKRLPALRSKAAEARKALNLDDKHRQVHGPQVMTGESARAQLQARLRARLDTAVADTALLPAWLVLGLGHQPVGEDVAKWMDTATSLLAYRVTYEVIDPVVALGPAAHDDPQRESWRRDLERRLKDRRHWPL